MSLILEKKYESIPSGNSGRADVGDRLSTCNSKIRTSCLKWFILEIFLESSQATSSTRLQIIRKNYQIQLPCSSTLRISTINTAFSVQVMRPWCVGSSSRMRNVSRGTGPGLRTKDRECLFNPNLGSLSSSVSYACADVVANSKNRPPIDIEISVSPSRRACLASSSDSFKPTREKIRAIGATLELILFFCRFCRLAESQSYSEQMDDW